MDRRQFVRSAASAGLLLPARLVLADSKKAPKLSLPSPSPAPAAAAVVRVIVIGGGGGGMAGATVAKYLRLWGDAVEVTLIERNLKCLSNILSSLVLTGQRTMSSLSFDCAALQSRYGVKRVVGEVVAVDPVRVQVRLANGSTPTAS